jgi:hypothetical protein
MMRQLVNIKKVSIDSDRKVSVLVEFMATSRESKDNVFGLIELQGTAVEISCEPAQQDMFDKPNGDRELESVGA